MARFCGGSPGGRTRGTVTWTMDETAGGRMLHVVVAGRPNVNPEYRLVGNKGRPHGFGCASTTQSCHESTAFPSPFLPFSVARCATLDDKFRFSVGVRGLCCRFRAEPESLHPTGVHGRLELPVGRVNLSVAASGDTNSGSAIASNADGAAYLKETMALASSSKMSKTV